MLDIGVGKARRGLVMDEHEAFGCSSAFGLSIACGLGTEKEACMLILSDILYSYITRTWTTVAPFSNIVPFHTNIAVQVFKSCVLTEPLTVYREQALR